MCQAVHAAHEAGIHLANANGVDEVSSVVVCSVSNEEELLDAQLKIGSRDIRTVLFHEPDLDNQATAIATEPIGGNLRKALSRYPLWKGK